MEKFQNKYRIPSTRAPFWNYGWNASYFVTICTYNPDCYFGDIVEGEIMLSDIGEIAEECWLKIPDHFPFVKLGAFIIMPNHVHGIIIIDKHDDELNGNGNENANVETQNFASLQQQPLFKPSPLNKFGPQSKNLPSIIRGFKIGVTKNARIINNSFRWQTRYHDHIIRDDNSFNNIQEYINSNPHNWHKDKFYLK